MGVASADPDIDPDRLQAVGVDWSGAASRSAQRSAIWVAVVREGRLVALETGRDRDEAMAYVRDLLSERPETVVGLDFAFSLPRWYLDERGIASGRRLWEWAAHEELAEAERTPEGADPSPGWPRTLGEPFWGPGIRPLPADLDPGRRFRRTEQASARPGARPQSPFQLSGAGSVGSQSLRGMAQLHRLEGVHVWPFDDPGWPLVLEVFPRLLARELRPDLGDMTGGALVEEVLESSPPTLWGERDDWRDAVAESQDAFDAVMSAWGLWACRRGLAALGAEADATYRAEGRIWSLGIATRAAGPDGVDMGVPGAGAHAPPLRVGVEEVERALTTDPALDARDGGILLQVYRLMRDRAPAGLPRSRPAQPAGSPPVVDLADGPRHFVAHWVAEGLVLCNLPFAPRHVEALHRQGVRTVINMTEDREYRGTQRQDVLDAYSSLGMVEHRLSTPDGTPPAPHVLTMGVDLFFGARRRGAVAVHCLGGRARSATVAAAVRARLLGEPADVALDAIQDIAPEVRPLPGQARILVDWARRGA